MYTMYDTSYRNVRFTTFNSIALGNAYCFDKQSKTNHGNLNNLMFT